MSVVSSERSWIVSFLLMINVWCDVHESLLMPKMVACSFLKFFAKVLNSSASMVHPGVLSLG